MVRLKRTPTVTSFTFSNDGTSMTSGRLRAGKENCTVQRRTLKFRVTVTRMMTQTVLKTSIKKHQQQRVDKESGNMYNKNCDSKLPTITTKNVCSLPKKNENCKKMMEIPPCFPRCHANRCQLANYKMSIVMVSSGSEGWRVLGRNPGSTRQLWGLFDRSVPGCPIIYRGFLKVLYIQTLQDFLKSTVSFDDGIRDQ